MDLLTQYFIALLVTGIVHLSLAAFILLKGIKKKVNQTYALYSVSIAIWAIFEALGITSYDKTTALFLWRINHMGVIFIPIGFVHFVYSASNITGKKRRLIPISYIIAFIFAGLNCTKLLILEVVPKFSFKYFINPGKIYYLFFFLWISWVLYGLFELFREYLKTSGYKRNQMKYFYWSMLIAYIGGVPNFFPTFNIEIPMLMPFSTYAIPIYAFFTVYAILKYRLMDITVALTRAGIFVIVYLFVLGIPFALGYKYGRWQLATWVTALLASAGPFIFLFLRRRAEDIIFKEQKAYQQALIELAKNMTRIRDLDKLYRTIVLTVVERVRVPFAAIYLKDEQYQGYQLKHYFPKREKERFPELIPLGNPLIELLTLKKKPLPSEELGYQEKIKLDSGLAIPCFMADTLLGFLVIGPKPGNRIYAPSDLLIFETLSYATALAIENSQFWREIEDRHRKARLQEMDTFSYSLAHEIDNPMTFVYNLARFLKGHFLKYITEQEERKEVEEACAYIMEGSERVMGMVKAIRQFGQKTTGELETLNLQEVIEGFFKLYAPELKAHFVICAKEMPDDAIYVKGVAAELQQVLMIFSKNSIHAMNYSQEKKLSLKLTKLNHSTARIAVSDTGCGIKKENLHAIFEPFFTTKASTEGTGMGLHNAKGFVLRHNGKIWAESEGEGKGATFIFELPILQGVNPEDFKKKEKTDWAF